MDQRSNFFSSKLCRGVSALLGCFLLSACTYEGLKKDTGNPVTRKFSWFSYVSGDDIRAACVEGAPNQYRFVYNGIYHKQVRTYDLYRTPGGDHELRSRVTEEAARRITTELGSPDLLQPWRAIESRMSLSSSELEGIRSTLQQSRYFEITAPEQDFASYEFYWTGAACIDGKYRFRAVKWPSAAYKEAALHDLLSPWDKTTIPFNEPYQVSLFDTYQKDSYDDYIGVFTVRMTPSGINRLASQN